MAYSFERYGVGNKIYKGGSSSPHSGGGLDKAGYVEREQRNRLKRNAMLRRMKAGNAGTYMNSDWLKGKRA